MRTVSRTNERVRTVMVTGGAGFIGRSVVAALLSGGTAVRVVDSLPDARQRTAAVALGGADIVVADLTSAPLRQLLLGVDAVIHLAGRPGVQASWGAGFDEYLRQNVSVTQRLLEAAGDRRVVVASSSSVYGEVADGLVSEGAPLRPVSPYGVSKVATEMLVHTYAARGADAIALRYFSVYGRHQRPDMAVARLLESAATGQPFRLRGDGSQRRDLTHIDDVVRATLAAVDAPLVRGTVINVGSARPTSLRDVIAEIEEQTGREVPITRQLPAPGDPARTAADHTMARALLGWQPAVDLASGLADQIRHHPSYAAAAETVA